MVYAVWTARKRQVEFWMAENQRVPKTSEVMEITGLKYDAARRLKNEVCSEMPEIDVKDIMEKVKERLMARLEDDDKPVSDIHLFKTLDYITPKKTDIKTDSNVEFKITIQKPDDTE